jgi:hypothetical protein
MGTVLWGARRGDVQYGSEAYWNTHLPTGVPTITVDTAAFWRVGDSFMTVSGAAPKYGRVLGRERNVLAVGS